MSKHTQCECTDPGCGHCEGRCEKRGTTTLYRVDMDDYSGTLMCRGCTDDAWESGLFTDDTDARDEARHGEE